MPNQITPNGGFIKRALLVVTNHIGLDKIEKGIGFNLNEIAVPYWQFYDAGYEVSVASIQGGVVDLTSLLKAHGERSIEEQRFIQSSTAMQQMQDTLCVDQIDTMHFTTLFLCGGCGALWDFKQSDGLTRVVNEFFSAKKLIACVGYGIAGLLSAQKGDGAALVKGLRLTSYSKIEEQSTLGQDVGLLPYHIEDILTQQGADYQSDEVNQRFMVWENGLITGQNSASVSLVMDTVLDTLGKIRVWIDTDLPIGDESIIEKPCDVSKAYALMSLFNATNIEVQGMSTIFGRCDVDESYQNGQMFAQRFGPISLPVVKGASKALQLDCVEDNAAVHRLAQELQKGPMSLIATGSVTNIATLVMLYPQLVAQIDRLVLVAGRSSEDEHFIVGSKQDRALSDSNFDRDPDAFRILLESGIPIVLTPFGLGHQVWLTQKEIDLLDESIDIGHYLKKHSQIWLDMWQEDFSASGFNPFDALAAGFLINPNHYKYQQLPVEVRMAADDTVAKSFSIPSSYKPYLIVSPECKSPYSVTLCTDVKPDFAQTLVTRINTPNNPAKYISAVSHINIIVDDVDKAAAFYKRTLGFEQAYDDDGEIMFYPRLDLTSFAKDAGFEDGKVDVDIRFLRHPNVGLYLELMRYYTPQGDQNISIKNTNDIGGVRHVALEVNNIMETFNYLKRQPGVEIVRYPESKEGEELTPPMVLSPFTMSFFYWRDQYGVQWEMECGRKRGALRGI